MWGRTVGIAPRILNVGAWCGEWAASRPIPLTNEQRAPYTHRMGYWVGCRVVRALWGRDLYLSTARKRNKIPRTSIL